jgi:hypothetical protein
MRNSSNQEAILQCAHDEHGVLSVIASGDFFRFTLDKREFVPASDSLDGYTYWLEAYRSGLYESLDHAISAANVEYPWAHISPASSHGR